MAQKTWSASDILTAADMNLYAAREGGAFTTWVPAVVQSGAVTTGVSEATYARSGRMIQFTAQLLVSGSGTTANDITITLPVTAKSAYTVNSVLGDGWIYDLSTTTPYHGLVKFATTTTVKLKDIGNSTGIVHIGQAFGLAANDTISIRGWYEAAAG